MKIRKVKPHRQIIHFIGGQKRTIENVIYVWENEMTHLITLNGIEWIINKNNVLCVEKVYAKRKKK
jgi:hypothetical protein